MIICTKDGARLFTYNTGLRYSGNSYPIDRFSPSLRAVVHLANDVQFPAQTTISSFLLTLHKTLETDWPHVLTRDLGFEWGNPTDLNCSPSFLVRTDVWTHEHSIDELLCESSLSSLSVHRNWASCWVRAMLVHCRRDYPLHGVLCKPMCCSSVLCFLFFPNPAIALLFLTMSYFSCL